MSRLFYLLSILLLVASCNEDPYPSDGEISGTEPNRGTPQRAFVIEPQSIEMNFNEGKESSYKFNFKVPSGKPVIRFTGLPTGAKFDEATNRLIWEPGFDAANNGNPRQTINHYKVRVWLRSSVDPATAIYEDVILKVNNTPRDFNANPSRSSNTVKEGKELTFDINVESVDYPNEQFAIRGIELPEGLTIKRVNNRSFKMKYKPSHNVVNLNESVSCPWRSPCHKTFEPEFIVTGPDGREITKKVTIKVEDVRLPATFNIGDEIQIGQDGVFTFSAFDQNNEIRPRITLSSRPSYGTIETKEIEAKSLLSGTMQVTWKDIPLSRRGETGEFEFKACLKDDRSSYDECFDKVVKVTISDRVYERPTVSRTSWENGQRKLFKFNQSDNFWVTFTDPTSRSRISDVKIIPESMKDMVTYSGSRIEIKATKEGIHHFQLEATSEMGRTRIENFIFEVLPENRSNILYMGDSARDPGLGYFQGLTKLNYFSPVLNDFNERNMIYRDTMILGSEIFKDAESIEKIFENRSKFKTIFISAANIQHLPVEFTNYLDTLGFYFGGRYSDQVGAPDLRSAKLVVVGDGMEIPTKMAKLKTTFSSESDNPTILKFSELTPPKCKSLMGLRAGAMEFLIAAKCPLPNGRKLIISGVEWGDFDLLGDDVKLPKKWFEGLMR